MSRFVHINSSPNGSKFANLGERLNAPLPGETVASTDPKYAKRDPAFRPQVAATPSAKVAASPAKAKPYVAPIDHVAIVKAEVKARHAAVMASSAVEGREAQAAELLLASCDRNAKLKTSTDIIGELRSRPTDADRDANATAEKHAKADALWAKAQATLDRQRGTPREPNATVAKASEPAAASVWDRAWANIAAQRGLHLHHSEQAQPTTKAQSAATGKPEKRTPEEVWERAYKAPKHLPGF